MKCKGSVGEEDTSQHLYWNHSKTSPGMFAELCKTLMGERSLLKDLSSGTDVNVEI